MTPEISTLRSNCRVASHARIASWTSLTQAVATVAGLALASGAFAADALSIRSLAPEQSILVFGIDDFHATQTRFEKSPVGMWWASKEVQEQAKPWRTKLDEGMDKMTQELGVSRDTLKWPTSLGGAVYAQLNEETGMHEPALMVFVDWAKDAEAFGKLYDAIVAKMEKDHADDHTVEEIKGHRVYVASEEKPAEGAKKDGGEEEGDDFEAFGGPPMDNPFKKMCFTRDGSRLLVAGSPGAMEELLGSLEDGKRKSVADTEDFRGTMELSGGTDGFIAFMTAPAQKLIGTISPEMMMATPFLSGLFGDIRGFGMGLTMDGKSAPIESSVGVYVPGGKKGLLSLLPAGPVEKVPAIVPSDAVSYARMNFQFSGLMKVVDDFIAGLPPAFQDQLKQGMEPFDPVLRAAFAGMGPGVHFWGTMKQPITAESSKTTFAVGMSDKNAVQKLAQTFAPMTGLAPRDFVGNTIYSSEDGFMPFALGLGGSYMFMGETESVEQSLRSLGQGDAASGLEGDPTMKAVRQHWTGDDLVGYGFTNTAATLEAQAAMFEEFAPMLEGATDEAVGDMPMELDLQLDTLFKVLDPKLMKDYFGPTTWEIRSLKTGFRFDTQLLPVAK
jgi:hypothetical protein